MKSRQIRTAIQRVARAVGHDIRTLTPRQIIEGSIILLITSQVLLFAINSFDSRYPVLGLRLEGTIIGRLYNSNFQKQVDAIAGSYENAPVTVKAENVVSTITLRQLGVNTYEPSLYRDLLAFGRESSMLRQSFDQTSALIGKSNIQLEKPHFNEKIATEYIGSLNQKVTVSPVNAYFIYKNNTATIQPDKRGQAIPIRKALAALRQVNPLRNPQLTLQVEPTTAAITESLLRPLLPQVASIAQKPLTIIAGESKTVLSPHQLVSLIVPKVTPDPKNSQQKVVQLSFNETKLNAIADEAVKRAVVAPQPTITSGGITIQQGRDGIQTEDAHSVARILKALVERQTGVAFPEEARIPLVSVPSPIVQQPARSWTGAPQRQTGTGKVRLTFDDGPGGYTEQILDILAQYKVHATFYVIGRNVQGSPGTMQRIKNEGHAIGNHSFNHANLAQLSRADIERELMDTQNAIQAACGARPSAFRPPYGSVNHTVHQVAASMGMTVDLWSVDPLDWARPGSNVITQRVLSDAGPGAVVLLHSIYQQTAVALPLIIEGLRAKGYTLE